MQKRILASLLVTPLAFSALADVTINSDSSLPGWAKDPDSLSGELSTDESRVSFTGTGWIATSVENLNPGTYKLNFTNASNIKVSVKVNGEENTLSDDYQFVVAAEGSKAEIIVQSEDGIEGFSFEGIDLVLVVDFSSIKSTLKTNLDKISLVAIADADDRGEAESLKSQYDNLSDEITTIDGEILDLDTESLENYNKYELWKETNKIQVEIDALDVKATAYNTNANQENAIWKVISDNRGAKTAYLDAITGFETRLTTQTNALAAFKAESGYDDATDATKGAYDLCFQIPTESSVEIRSKIDEFNSAVEAAYADETKEDIDFTDSWSDDIEAALVSLEGTSESKGEVQTSKDDWTAYTDILSLRADLLTALDAKKAALDLLKGVEGKEDNFVNYIAEQKSLLDQKYSETIQSLTVTIGNPVGAAASNDATTLTTAPSAFDAIVTAAEDTVKQNNDRYTSAMESVKELKDQWKEVADYTNSVPQSKKADYAALRQAVEDAIAALEESINTDYAAIDMKESYSTAAVTTAIYKVTSANSTYAPVATLYTNYESLKTYIAKLQSDSGIDKNEFSIEAKFAGTLNEIYSSIQAIEATLDTDDFDINNVQTVQGRIDQAKADADKLMGAYKNVHDQLASWKSGLSEIDKNMTTKQQKYLVEGNTWSTDSYKTADTSDAGYSKVSAMYVEFNNKLSAAAAAQAQDCYDKCIAIDADITDYDPAAKVKGVNYRFEKSASDKLEISESVVLNGNYVVVDNALTALKTTIENDGKDYYNKLTLDTSELDNDLATIRAAIDGFTVESSFDDWTEQDEALQNLLGKIGEMKTAAEALIANQDAYDALKSYLSDAGLDDKISALKEFNEKQSVAPAKAYYEDLIAGSADTSLQSRCDALSSELESLRSDQKAVAQSGAFKAKVDKLAGDIDAMKPAIIANNSNHDAQMIKSDEVRAHINSIIETIKSRGDEFKISEWVDILSGLLSSGADSEVIGGEVEGLATIDSAVTDAYGKGKSEADNKSLLARYDAVSVAADKVLGNFGDSVSDTNAETVASSGWSTVMTTLDQTYSDAIAKYNAYYALSNKGYREFIIKTVKTHEDIYAFSTEIADLKAAVQSFIDSKNEEGVVFSDTDFNAVWESEAETIVNSINNKVSGMTKDANTAAKSYYEDRLSNVTSAISSVKTDLTGAGIPAERVNAALKDADDSVANAESRYVPFESDPQVVVDGEVLSLDPMDDIADYLDNAESALNPDANALALSYWEDDLYKDNEVVLGYLDDLKKIVSADDTSIETMNGYVSEAEALNATVVADKSLVENISSHKNKLEVIIANAKSLYDIKKAAYDAAQQETELYVKYIGYHEDLQDELDALNAFAASVIGGDGKTYTNIQNLIDQFEFDVEYYHSDNSLSSHASELDVSRDGILSNIAIGYDDIKESENVELNGLISKTKVAYNNAATLSASLSAEDLAKYQEELNGYVSSVATLYGTDLTPDDKEWAPVVAQYTTDAVDIEKGLSALYVTLMSSYEPSEGIDGGNPVPQIIAALTVLYNDVDAKITAGEDALADCEESVRTDEDDYAGQYAALKADLDAVKTAWEADGNRVVLTAEIYTEEMNDLLEALETLAAEIADANQYALNEKAKVEANQSAYDRLSAQIADYRAEVEAIRDDAKEHDIPETNMGYTSLNDAENCILLSEEALKSQYDEVSLTDESSLTDEDDIVNNLNWARYYFEEYNEYTMSSSARSALDAAELAIAGNIVPEIKAQLQSELKALNTRYDAINSSLYDIYSAFEKTLYGEEGGSTAEEFVAAMHAAVDEYSAIVEAANDINVEAEENIFLKGDLSGDNVINILDLQRIIRIVGQGISYEDLYSESPREACAADVTNSGDLNIADVSRLLQLIIDAESSNAAPRLAPRRGIQTGDGLYGFDMISNDHTAREYAVAITGTEGFVAAQLDVTLPAGMTLEDAVLAVMDTDHEVQVFDNGNGNYRLLVFSMSNAVMNFDNGLFLTLATQGVGNPEISNVIFSDANGNAVMLNQADRSMLDSIKMDLTNLKDRIYNAAGQTLRSIQHGINIIRKSDGTSKKELH
ncbi:MAG: hypothetical protein ACI4AK_06725 [Lepagella sp.]